MTKTPAAPRPYDHFASPIDDRYFEDYVPGAVHRFGEIRVTAQDIIDFARRYDPQDFHTDPEKAAQTIFGGIIASGWMTGSLMMRMYADHYLTHNASLASPGIDELRWLAPVRPGDTLHTEIEVIEVRPSKSKPDRGIARLRYHAVNQRGEVVLTLIINHLLRRRTT